MSKTYIGTARKTAEINLKIVAENEEEALTILDNFVDNFDLFSLVKNHIYDLSVEEIDNKNEEKNNTHSVENESNNSEKCEHFCPIYNLYVFDE